ncbi:DUF551 domain-containing protein [Moraxella sp. ZY210820]|uniref:DUF551 domain-containing protein n=1 Tax=unclassified Moraxella TaxID=2685852 RepID=UPI0027310639|nr:DUF551 domain-containing protein [Moraxella sp. ZY210820]WLF83767.1 DUF551 domain-containing protein [Moraxella sp. ZY210820]
MIKYYLQNQSYYDGNIMNWWAKGRNGYTANLDNAHQFTAEELAEMSLRPTDVAWLCSYIDGKTLRSAHTSYCNYDEMKEQENMLLSQSNNGGWIKIEDGGFDEGQEILITDGKDVWTDTVMFDFDEGVHFIYFDNGSDPEAITHWQPKPQPPQE